MESDVEGRRGILAVASAALLSILLAAACGSNEPTTIALTAASSGSTVEATVRDPIVIRLEANLTTGYSWQLQPGLDEAVVTFVQEAYEQAPATSGLVGAGGTQTLEFKAVGVGSTSVSLAYQQTGSGHLGATFSVRIDVR
jgi:inhibitor of cysteine peptidase